MYNFQLFEYPWNFLVFYHKKIVLIRTSYYFAGSKFHISMAIAETLANARVVNQFITNMHPGATVNFYHFEGSLSEVSEEKQTFHRFQLNSWSQDKFTFTDTYYNQMREIDVIIIESSEINLSRV